MPQAPATKPHPHRFSTHTRAAARNGDRHKSPANRPLPFSFGVQGCAQIHRSRKRTLEDSCGPRCQTPHNFRRRIFLTCSESRSLRPRASQIANKNIPAAEFTGKPSAVNGRRAFDVAEKTALLPGRTSAIHSRGTRVGSIRRGLAA